MEKQVCAHRDFKLKPQKNGSWLEICTHCGVVLGIKYAETEPPKPPQSKIAQNLTQIIADFDEALRDVSIGVTRLIADFQKLKEEGEHDKDNKDKTA